MDEADLRGHVPDLMQKFDKEYVPPKWTGYDEVDRYESCSKCGALVFKHSIARDKHDEFHRDFELADFLTRQLFGRLIKLTQRYWSQ